MDGTLSPKDVKIAGLESEEEKEEKERLRQERLAAQRVKVCAPFPWLGTDD